MAKRRTAQPVVHVILDLTTLAFVTYLMESTVTASKGLAPQEASSVFGWLSVLAAVLVEQHSKCECEL